MNDIGLKLAECNFPRRHVERYEAKSCNTNEAWISVFNKVTKELPKGFMSALCGLRGVGKTQLATNIAAEFIGRAKSVYYITAMDFFVDLKSTFGRSQGQTQAEIIAEIAKPTLLVIDEFDKRAETEWENSLLFYVIDRRYRAVKNTLLISNHGAQTFSQTLGDSALSRMNECGGIISCVWESFRQNA